MAMGSMSLLPAGPFFSETHVNKYLDSGDTEYAIMSKCLYWTALRLEWIDQFLVIWGCYGNPSYDTHIDIQTKIIGISKHWIQVINWKGLKLRQ